MKNIAELLFEAKILKEIPRSGFNFLGTGKESIAEHSFLVTFIGYVMSQMTSDIDPLKLISMCIVHDLPETRTGDMNYVQKKYVTVDEKKAIEDTTCDIPFGSSIAALIDEFNERKSAEAQLAHDADQLAFILELKTLSDIGSATPEKWLPYVLKRLKTDIGKKLAESITSTDWDSWWQKNYVE